MVDKQIIPDKLPDMAEREIAQGEFDQQVRQGRPDQYFASAWVNIGRRSYVYGVLHDEDVPNINTGKLVVSVRLVSASPETDQNLPERAASAAAKMWAPRSR